MHNQQLIIESHFYILLKSSHLHLSCKMISLSKYLPLLILLSHCIFPFSLSAKSIGGPVWHDVEMQTTVNGFPVRARLTFFGVDLLLTLNIVSLDKSSIPKRNITIVNWRIDSSSNVNQGVVVIKQFFPEKVCHSGVAGVYPLHQLFVNFI